MSDYRLYDEHTAPEGAKETMQQVRRMYGFIPNLMAVMAESPALVKGYATISQIFEQTSFSNTEKQVVLLAVSYENACDYCMAAHSAAAEMTQVPAPVVAALREGRPLPDEKLEVLRQFVLTVVKSRGWPTGEEVETFLDAGYTRTQIFEVILGVGMKTLSNYTNHMAQTPLDAIFQPKEWKEAS